MSVTLYVALPFVRTEAGDLVADEGIQVQSATAALSKARHLSAIYAGVIAFSRTGDPTIGDFRPAVILASYGETPDKVE